MVLLALETVVEFSLLEVVDRTGTLGAVASLVEPLAAVLVRTDVFTVPVEVRADTEFVISVVLFSGSAVVLDIRLALVEPVVEVELAVLSDMVVMVVPAELRILVVVVTDSKVVVTFCGFSEVVVSVAFS